MNLLSDFFFSGRAASAVAGVNRVGGLRALLPRLLVLPQI